MIREMIYFVLMYPEISDLIKSFIKETMTEAKFESSWVKMSLKEKNDLRRSLGLRSSAPFSTVSLKRFSFRENQPRSEVLEYLLNYALLNTVSDYDEDMMFFPEEDFPDLVLVARSSDIASIMLGIMWEIKSGMTNYKDMLEESNFSLKKLYEGFLDSYKVDFSPIKPVEGTELGKKYSVISSSIIFQMIKDKSESIDKEEDDEEAEE